MSSITIRKELLIKEGVDGAISLLDPLMQNVLVLSPSESTLFRSQEYTDGLVAKLQGANMIEGIGAQVLRDCIWNARSLSRIAPQPLLERIEADWEKASELPSFIQERWRKPRLWAALFQSMLAGNDILILEDLIEPDALLDDIGRLSFSPCRNSLIQGNRTAVSEGLVWSLMQHPIFYSFVYSLLGLSDVSKYHFLNAWELHEGDFIGVHADGSRYQGTLSVGCTPNWKAQDGGAIAFGRPNSQGFDVFQRWLPQLGSALLFAPRADLWHVVETVQSGIRHTFTGWWTDKKPHIHAH